MLSSFRKSQQNGHLKKHKEEIVAQEPLPLIPPVEYKAVCKKAVYKVCQGGDKRLFIEFVIIVGKYCGAQLFMVCLRYPKLRTRHKLYNQWALVLGRKPNDGERLNRKIFEKKVYLISVRNTDKKFSNNNRTMPDFLQYSVVDTILEVIAGAPGDA